MWVIVIVIHSFTHTKTSYLPKNRFFTMFLTVFHCFSPFIPKSELLPSLFAPSLFFQNDGSDSLLSLFTKVQWERFALFQERIAILLFHLQKPAIRLKNQRVNSQPCISVYNWDSFLFRNSSAGRGGQGPGVWGDFWQLLHLRLWNGADKICVHIHHNILPSFR